MQPTEQQNNIDLPEKDKQSGFGKLLKNKTFQLLMIVLLIFLFILWIYSLGKQKGTLDQKLIPQVRVESDNTISADFKLEAAEMAKEIDRVTYGIEFPGDFGIWSIYGEHFEAKRQLYGKMLKLSRNQMFYLYNQYNLMFYTKASKTMAQAIIQDSGGLIFTAPESEKSLISKIKALKLP